MYYLLSAVGLIAASIFMYLKNRDESIKNLDAKEHPLKSLYPIAQLFSNVFFRREKGKVFGSDDQMRGIFINHKPEDSRRLQACKCIASVLAVIILTLFVCFAYDYSHESLLLQKTNLKRAEAGGGVTEYDLILTDPFAIRVEKKVRVSEVKLEGEELEKLKERSAYYIDNAIFRKGETSECVREGLNLISEIPKSSVTIKWSDDNSWFLSSNGKLKNQDLEEPVTVRLHAVLSYFDEVWDYEKEITIHPPIVTEEDTFANELERVLEETDKNTQNEDIFRLPDKIDGKTIEWEEKEDDKTGTFFILGIFSAVAVFMACKQDLKKKLKERNEQMMRDYPDVISKFVMLITAGMTCRAAWGKICSDYLKVKEKTGGKELRFAYEEMLISDREMQLGMPETKVYERFGNRCCLPAYNRFGTLLSRNIKRGSSQIIEILESESRESIAERRENVRKKGEETGTKLLLPMFGMLILVIAIVVVPAFSSFSF